MHRTSVSLLAVFGSLLLLVSSVALAFTTQGHKYPNAADDPVEYQLHAEGSADVTDGSDLEAIRRAFNTWEEVSCSYLKFAEEPWEDPKTLANDGKNRIFWVELANEWPGDQGTLALTYTFWAGADNNRQITGADIIVNGASWSFTTDESQVGGQPPKVDLETVLFHEIGHFFGLDHSQDPNAAMYASNNKPTQRNPSTDDIHGICSLYPNGQPLPDDPNGNTGAPVGSACQAHSDCSSSICIEDTGLSQTYCTGQCSTSDPSSCPAGFTCVEVQLAELPDITALCAAPQPVDELCDQCDNGTQCASGLCVTVTNRNNGNPFCSRLCDPSAAQPTQCPEGFQCELTQQALSQIGACVPTTGVCQPRGKGGQNEICYANGSCKPGFGCFEYWSGTGLNYCYQLCYPEAVYTACGDDSREVCLPVEGVQNTFSCFSVSFVGEPCLPEICGGSTLCLYDVSIESAMCYATCNGGQTECPANTQCTVDPNLADAVCVPNDGFKYDGDSCDSNNECISTVCRVYGAAKLCTRPCAITSSTDCNPGLVCIPDAGGTQGLCWPESFVDPNATDPTRGDLVAHGYCSCDTTNECDDDCDCDPECGSDCSCSATHVDAGVVPFLSLLCVFILGLRRFI